ncbi:hypothetical protein BGZ80_008102 [Entomortierella chlamydospora]|uniref:Uncharacterized protein n=1 Tax=Entomortierella chlamydospora TaxID=101097 RepID=A0A9P6N523_9FUNG|nr:hypothetical protein BGZ80_008102 [Entomortierella chlamydospora]
MGACEFLEHSYITSFRSRKRQQYSTSRVSSSSSASFFPRSPSLQEPSSPQVSIPTAESVPAGEDASSPATTLGLTLEESSSSSTEEQVNTSGSSELSEPPSPTVASASTSSSLSCAALEEHVTACTTSNDIDISSVSGSNSGFNHSDMDAHTNRSEPPSPYTTASSADNISMNTNLETMSPSMAFAMGKEMICPLCRYLHKNQPFMNQESDSDVKPVPGQSIANTNLQQRSIQNRHPFSRSPPPTTLHEHPTSGTVFSMMPSLFETSLGHGPAAGTIRTSPGGICLKTSTWLMLYVMPFTISICFLAFVLGKVETMWSKVSCLIGAAICYMVCWALVVAIMNPDHEARDLLERLNQMQRNELSLETQTLQSSPLNENRANSGSDHATTTATTTLNSNPSDTSSPVHPSSLTSEPSPSLWTTWSQHRYVQSIQDKVMDLSRMLDDLPGDWW